MSKFISTIVFEEEFEGDRIVFKARPMLKEAALKLFAALPDRLKKEEAAQESKNATPEEMTQIVEIFSSHLMSIEGLRDSAGNPVPMEVLLGSAYFIPLVTTAASRWAERSMPETAPSK